MAGRKERTKMVEFFNGRSNKCCGFNNGKCSYVKQFSTVLKDAFQMC